MFRINMVLAIGAVPLVRNRLHDTPPIDYYAAAMVHEDSVSNLSGLERIQAILLILVFSLQHDVGSKLSKTRVFQRDLTVNPINGNSWK